MKQLKKGLLTLLVGVFGLLSVNAQTNLLENGDFKKGTKGWFLNGFELGKEGDYALVQTGYYSEFFGPSIKTDGQVIEGLSGNTYTFSFWAKGFTADNLTVNIKLKDKDDKELYDSQIGIKRNFKLDMVEENGSWKKFSKTITFPSNVAKLFEFRISFSGDDYNYKAVSEISMIKKENPAPKDFKVVEDKLNQRVAELSWKAEQGKVYKVNVNNKDYTVSNGNTLVLTDLSPNTEYTASIYAEGTPNAKANTTFKTKDFVKADEEDRVPFLANIDDKKLPAKFLYAVNDLTGGAVENITITFKGEPATIDNGYVTLPASVTEGELVITITQKEEGKTIITYKSITKK